MSLWRETGRSVKFVIFDGRSSFALLIYFFHWAYWTFYLAVGTLVFFAVINYFGYTMPNAFRKGKVLLLGSVRRARPWWRQRYYR